MDSEALTRFISEYIAARKQKALETFDKAAVKQLAEGEPADVIAAKRQELVERYVPRHWLTDAARRAGQISLVTHAAKFTHGDSKSISFFIETSGDSGYLSTASLSAPSADAVGNAAALDVAKLLQTEVEGQSLLTSLKQGNYQPLRAFAESGEQLDLWVSGFREALVPGKLTSHTLAKQIYFPVEEGYHLLSPLFASSLAHAVHEKLATYRFGDEAKAIREAHRAEKWHSQPDIRFPNLAVMNFGGTKPQNISSLNSSRGGRAWLLSAQPPVWEAQNNPPQNVTSVFTLRGSFRREAPGVIKRLAYVLAKRKDKKHQRIRQFRAGHVEELIDLLLMQGTTLQQEKWRGWTKQCPELPHHQQLWLDPWRALEDGTFRIAREKGEWQRTVADDFARWLNRRLTKEKLIVGESERKEWRTLCRRRLREMDAIVQEALK